MAQLSMDTTRDVFTVCQSRPNAFEKGINELLRIYKSRKHEESFNELISLLQIIFVDNERTISVERLIDLVAQFVVSPELLTQADEGDYLENRLLVEVLSTLLEWSQCDDRLVRQRCCELIGRIQHHLKDDSVLDDDLFEDMETKMLARLADAKGGVRAKAVGALHRLQEPRNSHCRIVSAYMFHLSHDPNPEVRSEVLKSIVPSNRSLDAILTRTRDVKEGVRKVAFERVTEKVPVKYMSIKQRMTLLESGLKDRCEAVQKMVSEQLLPTWLSQCGESPVALLRMLDCHSHEETVAKVLNILFEKVGIKETSDDFKAEYLDERRVIPRGKLTCEAAMFWKHLALYLRSKNDSDADSLLESIVPVPVEYSSYICDVVLSPDGSSDALKRLEHCFISQQLIGLAQAADLSDNAGRESLIKSMQKLFLSPMVGSLIVPQLIEVMRLIYSDNEKLLQAVMAVVEELQAPFNASTLAANDDCSTSMPLDIQVARLKIQLNAQRQELAEAVQAEDVATIVELRSKIQESEDTLAEKRRQMKESPEMDSDDEDDLRLTGSDPNIILKCLTAVAEVLQNTVFSSLPSCLQTFMYEMILPRISMEDMAVRKQATRALALCCILSKEVAKSQMRLLLEVAMMDRPPIQAVALSGSLDLVLSFGAHCFLPTFKSIAEGQTDVGDDSCQALSLDLLVTFFVDFLDAEDWEVKTTALEGIAKLQLYRHIWSPSLLSKLILLWFNPSTDPNSLFRQVLGAFMAAYSSLGDDAIKCFEEAFLETLRTLFSAPSSSPLSQIDPLEVVTFLVDVTLVHQTGEDGEGLAEQTPHDRLAEELCNEVLKKSRADNVHVLLKALSMLHITESASLKELQMAVRRMERGLQQEGKRNLTLVKKIAAKVKLPSQEEDEDIDTPVTIDTASTSSAKSGRTPCMGSRTAKEQQREMFSSEDLFPSSPEG